MGEDNEWDVIEQTKKKQKCTFHTEGMLLHNTHLVFQGRTLDPGKYAIQISHSITSEVGVEYATANSALKSSTTV